MPHRIAFVPALFVLALAARLPTARDPGLGAAERQALRSALAESRDHLQRELEGLSDAQWRFKPSPDAWSIAEIVEHLALAEERIPGMIRGTLATAPAADTTAAARTAVETRIVAAMGDRGMRAQAPEILRPSNRWGTTAELRTAFESARSATLAYVAATDDPLRAHAIPHPAFGPLDGYQWLLFLAAHTDRHAEQVAAVKRAPGWPAR